MYYSITLLPAFCYIHNIQLLFAITLLFTTIMALHYNTYYVEAKALHKKYTYFYYLYNHILNTFLDELLPLDIDTRFTRVFAEDFRRSVIKSIIMIII